MKRRSFFGAVGGFVGMLFGYPATPPPVPTAEQSFAGPPGDVHAEWHEQSYGEDANHGLILDIEGWPGTLTFYKIVIRKHDKKGNVSQPWEWLVAEREDGSAAVWVSNPGDFRTTSRPLSVDNISEIFSASEEMTKETLSGAPIKEPVT